MKFPFSELSLRDPEHVAWLKSQRDPELWHAAGMAAIISGDPHGFLPWLFDQPEVDRATAGYVFFGVYGNSYLEGGTEFGGEGLSDEEWRNVMAAICRRAAGPGFAGDKLGLHPGFEASRRKCLDLVKSGKAAQGIPIPHPLLDTPFPPERKSRFLIEDGVLLES